jgi:starch synthase (maltosyl-transferring)
MGFNLVGSAPVFAPGRLGNVFLTADHDAVHPALGAGAADVAIARVVDSCRRHDIGFVLDLVLDRVAGDAVIRAREPGWFEDTTGQTTDTPDPRRPPHNRDVACADFDRPGSAERLAQWWIERLVRLARTGLSGFRCLRPDRVPASIWKDVIAAVRAAAPDCLFLAWTQGAGRDAVGRLAGVGFDHIGSSLAWWDARASWFVEEAEALRQVAPSVASPEPSFTERLATRLDPQVDVAIGYRRALRLAAATASGILVPMGFEFATRRPFDPTGGAPRDFDSIRQAATCDLSAEIRDANALVDRVAALHVDGEVRPLTGPGDRATAILRADAADVRVSKRALVIAVNPDLLQQVPEIGLWPLPSMAGAAFGCPKGLDANDATDAPLAPGEVRVFQVERAADIRRADGAGVPVAEAVAIPRVVVAMVAPVVDGPTGGIKRVCGEPVVVQADVFTDGHDELAAELLWRGADEEAWHRVAMRPLGNDRWEGRFVPQRVGRHVFTVEGWWDEWATFRRNLRRTHDAGLDIAQEIDEGCTLLRGIAQHAEDDASCALNAVVERLAADAGAGRQILLADETQARVSAAQVRPFLVRHAPAIPIDVDRPQAAFASWYELFPRSVTDSAARHGTFADVIGRLPAIRAMGFDVLYFPPIHPIGTTNRKGRNNSLHAGSEDVGSPYAIGSAEGGHDSIHPALGTLEDFRRLVAAAGAHGLEIALDFAIQCSPDHPWLTQHPNWFRWRSDGTVRYAENPPKKYEDIVNVDFYAPTAVPDLWIALRDVVRFWIDQGVHIFRVDNPHTKPLPFWQWLIADIHADAPGVIFLAEAFTRPTMMYQLAKIGFTQSYSYFTWRNTKQELTEYLTELNTAPVRDFFRPNFFVNTPDINPISLQTAGRAGFLIRAALAATLSGLWGMYSGFEICEAAPLPGREEYLDSEKYEIRPRDFQAPGNIVAEITALNRIRRANPALHSHLGVRFYNAFNDQVLLYGKRAPCQTDMLLIAVNLNPHAVEAADIEIPLWEWNLPDDGSLMAEDLVRQHRLVWTGKRQHIRLDPADLPYAIWRVAPFGDA